MEKLNKVKGKHFGFKNESQFCCDRNKIPNEIPNTSSFILLKAVFILLDLKRYV
jgi:hypothetical protein